MTVSDICVSIKVKNKGRLCRRYIYIYIYIIYIHIYRDVHKIYIYIYIKELEKLAAKFSNFLLKQEQDFLTTFSFSTSFMGCQRFTNLKLFRKPCKFKTVNMLKYMNPVFNFTTNCCRSKLSYSSVK